MKMTCLRASAMALALMAAPLSVLGSASAETIRVSYATAADHPYGLGVKKFAEVVEAKTGGRIRVRGFPSGQIGPEVQSISAAQGGILEVVVTSTAALSGVDKAFGVFDLPYIFETDREADTILDGPVGTEMLRRLDSKGLVGLCFWEAGFHQVTNSRRPIKGLDDFRGLKIRTIQNPVMIDVVNTLGSNAVPMPYTEVYTSLETKAIDGQTGTYPLVFANKIFEVQKYITEANLFYAPVTLLMSKKYFDGLSPADQAIMRDACAEARTTERDANRALSPEALKQMQAAGLQSNVLDAATIGAIKEKLRPVVDKHMKALDPEIVAALQTERAKLGRGSAASGK
ncbi:TRAP transporter substrate-binding protein DctP [Aquabacter sp. L1I39]|uniref:TRAP transporter substrate-binding protein DctP n=1 Tax=Aquabacter sp. L1I39 TaxID=2820278 RepID=UPI001ADAE609|nr:TRAP transporter substrate-binding protein DctP [Aquabacter sp. L1I39]QTL04765.1 TRAP transporter substrate-binding protein DctP [Aquabacter sp. L1I39]